MKNDWKLTKIEIEFKRGYKYDNSKDRYEGRIQFQNGDLEQFSFKIKEDLAQPYIDLIAKDIVRTAESLGERLCVSLGLKSENIEIETSNKSEDETTNTESQK